MKGEKGSFTIEISLLMLILIPLLVCLIYMGFYMHDRAFLEGAALETACVASLNAGEENQGTMAEMKKEEFLRGKLFGTRDVVGTVELGTERVSVVFSGNFTMPGMLLEFLGKSVLPIRADAQAEIKNPKKTVNKIHSLAKIAG
ncbi:MAG: hypothetical protein Q4F41_19025 [Eubacteriales bacterium]|nr:hypothetical protein [Eubacteriales bacterium]